MTTAAIECRKLSKRYVLDHRERYVALRDRLSPAYLLGTLLRRRAPETREDFWALKDVSFDVQRGEALGIIGRNGAGKSTLLKVLARVVTPTAGEARLVGRIASLLEVGTGFHPELTGRENIYLNGAILGLRRAEIRRKFDAIVDFAGTEKFLDTPVKRYSSGMYVRLAFAVAAHLEPEILIVDEVLAVGDAEFQRKCLGKMQDVAREDGRTILFVSHNMTAVQSLCRRAIWLDGGSVVEEGDAGRVVASYLSRHGTQVLEQEWLDPATAPGNDTVRLRRMRAVAGGPDPAHITVNTPFRIETEFLNHIEGAKLNLSLAFNTLGGECLFAVGGGYGEYARGLHRISCEVPANLLNDGVISLGVLVVQDQSRVVGRADDALTVHVHDGPRDGAWLDKWPGAVRPTFLRWEAEHLEGKANGAKIDAPVQALEEAARR